MNNKPTLYILSGISCAGKTTWTQNFMKSNKHNAVVCSADHHFINHKGEYNFVPGELPIAHARCLKKCCQWASGGKCDIVIDNTNLDPIHISPYYYVGIAYGYEPKILLFDVPLEIAKSRNTKNIPEHTFDKMYEMFQNLPAKLDKLKWSYYDATDSNQL